MSENLTVEERLLILESKVAFLESRRPGRKKVPVIASEQGVCGVDPTCDSEYCEVASLYRHQQGCRGKACTREYGAYYESYRKEYKEKKQAAKAAMTPQQLADTLREVVAELPENLDQNR